MSRLLALLALLLPMPPALACPGLVIGEAWIREPPPGARGTAAYFTLRNEGPAPLVLDGWSSPAFAHVMLHETVVTGDRAEMRHRGQLSLAAGGREALTPGGLHLMLMQATGPIAAGAAVTLQFTCNGQAAQLSAPVLQEAPSSR